MSAVNCELLTKIVPRALPFQFTTEVDTKPAPLTIRVKPAPPGATASGTSGWLIRGTGLVWARVTVPAKTEANKTTTVLLIEDLGFMLCSSLSIWLVHGAQLASGKVRAPHPGQN